jgi:hypothetical protein
MAKKNTSLAKLKRGLHIDPNKLDKYLDYYATGNPLDEEGMMMLERYRKAWSWLSMGRTYDVTLAMMMKDYTLADRQARYIIAEAVAIHGQIAGLDKDGKRAASVAFFRLLANMAMMDQDYDTAGRLTEKADKLEGLHDDAEAGWDPDAFSKPGKFVFINNVNVLQQHLKKQFEDDE